MASNTASRNGSAMQDADRILRALAEASQLLPSQAPLDVFVHHNALDAFAAQGFQRAVMSGLEIYGCQPYLSEQRFHKEMHCERICLQDIAAALRDDLAAAAATQVTPMTTRFEMRLAMLRCRLECPPAAELNWLLAETDVLKKFRPETTRAAREAIVTQTKQLAFARQRTRRGDNGHWASLESWSESRWESYALQQLWQACVAGTARIPPLIRPAPHPPRHRDALWSACGIDSDELVHEVLVRFCLNFLDQGLAGWPLPHRERGMLRCFAKLYAGAGLLQASWMHGLPTEARRILDDEVDAVQLVAESLRALTVAVEEWPTTICGALLALRGWAGMIWQMESHAPWIPQPAPAGTLLDFLAIRLLLDRLAVSYLASSEFGLSDPRELLSKLTWQLESQDRQDRLADAYVAFQVAQSLGWSVDQLETLTIEDWKQILFEIRDFDGPQRRKILQLAYEGHYRQAALDALAAHAATVLPAAVRKSRPTPVFQVVTCIDDREESFRRHLEESQPSCETFGAAGFFSVVMYYRGAAEAHYRPLCPVSAVPRHFVREEPRFSATPENAKRSTRRRLLGLLSHQVHTASRNMVGGLLAGVLGSFATLPLVARVLAPHTTARVCHAFGAIMRPSHTELHLERDMEEPGSDYASRGFSLPEMAGIVTQTLNDIGLVDNFSKLVLFLGHGSSSLNNPHESAYNCGACSGGRGGPNARSFAIMANDRRVRQLVAEAGIVIPDSTHFIGGYHNTCNERVEYFDLDRLPRSHRTRFRKMEQKIHEARGHNAVERCRRFELAPFGLTPAAALGHVEERAEDLSQARPEYNHATNALCLVGERLWSRGLFLDRRAFLASYDPHIDDDRGSLVERILQAAMPICSGISLEYYFSTVDPEGYGCGSKLPHNIAALVGVMTGAASDLRPGLSSQMVEIHEPLRLLFVVQTTVDIMRRIMNENRAIQQLVAGDWVQLALLNSENGEVTLYHRGEFQPHSTSNSDLPHVNRSLDWFEGRSGHLGFAVVDAAESRLRANQCRY